MWLGVAGYFAFLRETTLPIQQVQTASPATTQTPKDETSNWKTYSNSQYGFEFKYPQDWLVEEYPGVISEEPSIYPLYKRKAEFENHLLISIYDSKIEGKRGQDIAVILQIFDPSPIKDIEKACLPERTGCITSHKNINGLKFTINTFGYIEEIFSGIGREVISIKDGKLFRFYTDLPEKEKDVSASADKIFYIDRITNTFKFTE